METIIILTDSLGLPRTAPSQVRIDEAWPGLLQKSLIGKKIIYQFCMGGATTDELLEQVSYLEGEKVEKVIVQCGIVDCAPRAFRKNELQFLRAVPIVKKFIRRSVLNFLRKFRSISYVNKNNFRNNALAIKNKFHCPVYWVAIVGSNSYKEILPGVDERIDEYNKILKEIYQDNLIEMSHILDEDIMSDGHHLNKSGHQKLFETLTRKIV